MSGESGITVDISVSGIELNSTTSTVIAVFEEVIETFLRKNANYGNSFENSAMIESILKHGEVKRDDLFNVAARQIFVRGFMDKLSRFYQLQFMSEEDRVGESIYDTLLDLGNYSIMLAALYVKYNGHPEEEEGNEGYD